MVNVFLRTSFAFLPIVYNSTSLSLKFSSVKFLTPLIILELNAPAKPRLEEIATTKTFFTSRCSENLLSLPASKLALRLCKSSVSLSE